MFPRRQDLTLSLGGRWVSCFICAGFSYGYLTRGRRGGLRRLGGWMEALQFYLRHLAFWDNQKGIKRLCILLCNSNDLLSESLVCL